VVPPCALMCPHDFDLIYSTAQEYGTSHHTHGGSGLGVGV
jgi:hypothetical protein